MQVSRYFETTRDRPQTKRSEEHEALMRVVTKLVSAQQHGIHSIEAIEATALLNNVWCRLLEDLASPDNGLDTELKARLVSIGIFLLKEIEAVRTGRSESLDALSDITRSLAEGLA